MATTFLEPGGDATFNVALTNAGGFYQFVNNTPSVVTDIVHGTHIKSIQLNNTDLALSPNGVVADAGGRISLYLYINALPSANDVGFLVVTNSGDSAEIVYVKLTTAGVLKMTDKLSTQIGSNGSTLSIGTWYRISLAYTITSTTVNRFELFKNGVSDISITNATLTNTGSSCIAIGQTLVNDISSDFRVSDIYVDNSSSLKDTGDIWVTAKRPNANGTANQFVTQIGSGGSGYGTGHTSQVNERPLSTTNGWSKVNPGGSVFIEQYNIEDRATGDFNISNFEIIDYMSWIYASSSVNQTGQIIYAGAANSIALTSTNTMYTAFAYGTKFSDKPYPLNNAVGIQTNTDAATVSLYECGIVVAFSPSQGLIQNYAPYIKVGSGMSRSERAT